MFARSGSDASAAIESACFATGVLSPVSAPSAVWSEIDWTTRASAAMVAPSSIASRSPGTISAAGTAVRSPSRTTSAVAAVIRLRLASARSARSSCMKPRAAFATTMARIASAS